MEQRTKVLLDIFEPISQDCKTWRDDLQLALTLNPDLEKVEKAMDEWAKQEAIAFSIFKREYQLIEGMNHKHNVTDKIGLVSWSGASDEKIWTAYKKGEQLLRWIEDSNHPDNLLKNKSKP